MQTTKFYTICFLTPYVKKDTTIVEYINSLKQHKFLIGVSTYKKCICGLCTWVMDITIQLILRLSRCFNSAWNWLVIVFFIPNIYFTQPIYLCILFFMVYNTEVARSNQFSIDLVLLVYTHTNY